VLAPCAAIEYSPSQEINSPGTSSGTFAECVPSDRTIRLNRFPLTILTKERHSGSTIMMKPAVVDVVVLLCALLRPFAGAAQAPSSAAEVSKLRREVKAKMNMQSKNGASAVSTLQDEIQARTKKMKSAFGGSSWRYAKVAAPLNVRVPVITDDFAILWNYLGQTAPPTQVKVSPPEYQKLLRVTLLAIRQLSTAAGVAKAQEGYDLMNAALNDSYYEAVGVEYNGTLWDYFEGYHRDVESGPTLDWIPYASIIPESRAMPGTPTLQQFLTEIGLLHPSSSRDLASETSVQVCKCRRPPAGCRVDGNYLDVVDCLFWPESAPVVPEPCGAVGFLVDNGLMVCANVLAECTGPDDLYQEIFSVWGETVYCCRCTPRRPHDPLPGESCPSSWAVGDAACLDLATGNCKDVGGLFSTTLNPKCCVCEDPVARRLSLWDDFTAWFQNACFTMFPGASELGTAASVAEMAGPRAIGGFMNGLAQQSCGKRAGKLEEALFRDPGCTQKYTTAIDIQLGCAVESQLCGLPGHPVRAHLPGPRLETPMTYYLRDGSSCQAHQWDENFAGTLLWCG
jgi:hypothetical protein